MPISLPQRTLLRHEEVYPAGTRARGRGLAPGGRQSKWPTSQFGRWGRIAGRSVNPVGLTGQTRGATRPEQARWGRESKVSRVKSSDPVGGVQSALARSDARQAEGRSGLSGSASEASSTWSSLPGLEDAESIDPAELEEFLAADGAGVEADPIFKERLRRTLWRMVSQRQPVSIQDDD